MSNRRRERTRRKIEEHIEKIIACESTVECQNITVLFSSSRLVINSSSRTSRRSIKFQCEEVIVYTTLFVTIIINDNITKS